MIIDNGTANVPLGHIHTTRTRPGTNVESLPSKPWVQPPSVQENILACLLRIETLLTPPKRK